MSKKQVVTDAVLAPLRDDEPCDCAPTAAEKRSFWPQRLFTRRGAIGVGALGAAALTTIGIVAGGNVAFADDYPTWEDVENARQNEALKGQEITRIQSLINQLAQRVQEAQAASEAASNEFFTAQQAFFDASQRADTLQEQADEQSRLADESERKAGQIAAKMYRNGGDDTALELFFSESSDDADELLAQLGTMDKILEYNKTINEKAVSARNTAQQLSDQAVAARDERDRLQKIAEEKMIAAQNAADAAQAALDAQAANLMTLEAQLAALQDQTAKTVAAYQEGVEVRRKAEEDRKRREEEERQRLAEQERQRLAAEQQRQKEAAAQAAASRPAASAPAASSGDTGGVTAASGWVRPHGGYRSSGYGYRTQLCGTSYCSSSFHRGVDLANGCSAAIYAAYPGTVDAAFYNGGYGNWVRIQHGNGVATGYAHINSFAVSPGQWVEAGQVIAYAGNTGNSFGCHLHFEVYINGSTVNPIDFMAARGISV